MSGTSLDGIDIVHCTFSFSNNNWEYQILDAMTVPYSSAFSERLELAQESSALELTSLDNELGQIIGLACRDFIKQQSTSFDFIASHGHTVFHQPDIGITKQIGSGAYIASITGLPTICDFRTMDVAYSGQGAPLVPIGDQLLFSEFSSCINLGGFANISYSQKNKRIAYDICPVNIVLNDLAMRLGQSYDLDGLLAKQGKLIPEILERLNNLSYYKKKPPKSLGKEWSDSFILSELNTAHYEIVDLLRTYTEHCAIQIGILLNDISQENNLITGGGAFNKFLIDRIKSNTSSSIAIPDALTINYKEALIFAFLGLLRWTQQPNCLKSVTGASKNNIGGAIYLA